MNIKDVPFQVCDWGKVPSVEHAGETGHAYWRTVEIGNIRVRLVEYSPGYMADHWCDRGHVIFVLVGQLVTELKDGRIFQLVAGQSYQVADGEDPHRSRSESGAKLFIVD